MISITTPYTHLKNKFKSYTYRFIAVLFFGAGPVIVKNVFSTEKTAVSIVSLSFLAGLFLLFPFIIYRFKSVKKNINKKLNLTFLLLVIFQVLFFLTYFQGIQFTTATNGAFFLNLAPPLALALSVFLLKNSKYHLPIKIDKFGITSLLLIVATVSVFIFFKSGVFLSPNPLGNFFLFLALVFDTIATMHIIRYSKERNSATGLDYIILQIALVALLLSPFALNAILIYQFSFLEILGVFFLGGGFLVLAMWLSYISFRNNDGLTNYMIFGLMPLVTLLLETLFFEFSTETAFFFGTLILILISLELLLFTHVILRYHRHEWQYIVVGGVRQGLAFLGGIGVLWLGHRFLIENAVFGHAYTTLKILSLGVFGIGTYKVINEFVTNQRLYRWLKFQDVESLKQINKDLLETPTSHQTLSALNKHLETTFGERTSFGHSKITKSTKKQENLIEFFEKENEDYLIVLNKNKKRVSKELYLKEAAQLGSVVFPLWVRGKIRGFWHLGKKDNGDIYSRPEIEVLEKTRHYLRMYFAFVLYQQTLQQEVSQKTHQLKDQNEKLKALDRMKDDFVSIASHELKTPMAIIKGYTEILMQETAQESTEKQTQKKLKVIHKNTSELLNLTNNMLDVSKIQAGKLELDWEVFDLNEFLAQVHQEFSVVCLKKSVHLDFKVSSFNESWVESDPTKLKQILQNLLSNALKVVSEKTGKITIELKKSKTDYEIYITDNGPGIAPDQQKLIFEKFQQTEDTMRKEYSGTGLGLYITKSLITLLKGTIRLTSPVQSGQGAQFCFTLPLLEKSKNR